MTKKSSSKIITNEHRYLHFVVQDTFPSHSVIDDVAYADFELWKTLPRGCAVVKTFDGTKVHTLHGTPKFGDSSDNFGPCNLDWDVAYACVKENGECFHVSFFEHDSKVYCILGSKNVHLLVSVETNPEDQLEKIAQEQPERTRYAIKMARKFFKSYYTPELARAVVESGVTLCGEYINPEHKHIVEYSSEKIVFFAITHPDKPNGWYTVCTPEQAAETFTLYSLPFCEYTKCINQEQLQTVQTQFFNKENSEGLVIYYCSGDTVINMHKYKNKQYTVLRTIREMYNSGSSVGKLQDRLQAYHIKLTQNEIQVYLDFFKWCKHQRNTEGYSVRWWYTFQEQGAVPPDNSNKAFIMLVGVPGSGKTTIGCTLMMTMLSEKIKARYVDQDMFNQNPKTLFENVNKLICDPNVDVIIHGKSNTTKKMREQTLASISDEQLYIVVFEPNLECIQRIRSRDYHPNLKNNHPGLDQIVKNFIHSYEPPVEEEFLEYSNFREIIHVTYGDPVVKVVQDLYHEIVSEVTPTIIPFNWSLYIGIKIDERDLHKVVQELKVYDSDKFLVRANTGSCHVTLIHNNDYTQNWEASAKLYSMIGQKTQVHVTGLCWDKEISAFRVKLDTNIPCLNTQPHISWYKCDNKIQNFASNTMFLNCIEEPVNIMLDGTIAQF